MQAQTEYNRIRKAVAFNIDPIATRRNVNQFMREYTFPDRSILRLYRDGRATVSRDKGDYQTLIIGEMRVNAFGK